MSTDNRDAERRPRPGGEKQAAERSASHAALEAVETIGTGGGLMLGGLAVKDLYGQAKNKLSSKDDDSHSSSDSKN
jgi:hypothetical protein